MANIEYEIDERKRRIFQKILAIYTRADSELLKAGIRPEDIVRAALFEIKDFGIQNLGTFNTKFYFEMALSDFDKSDSSTN